MFFKEGQVIDFFNVIRVEYRVEMSVRLCDIIGPYFNVISISERGHEHFYDEMIDCAKSKGIFTIPAKPLTLEEKADKYCSLVSFLVEGRDLSHRYIYQDIMDAYKKGARENETLR